MLARILQTTEDLMVLLDREKEVLADFQYARASFLMQEKEILMRNHKQAIQEAQDQNWDATQKALLRDKLQQCKEALQENQQLVQHRLQATNFFLKQFMEYLNLEQFSVPLYGPQGVSPVKAPTRTAALSLDQHC